MPILVSFLATLHKIRYLLVFRKNIYSIVNMKIFSKKHFSEILKESFSKYFRMNPNKSDTSKKGHFTFSFHGNEDHGFRQASNTAHVTTERSIFLLWGSKEIKERIFHGNQARTLYILFRIKDICCFPENLKPYRMLTESFKEHVKMKF